MVYSILVTLASHRITRDSLASFSLGSQFAHPTVMVTRTRFSFVPSSHVGLGRMFRRIFLKSPQSGLRSEDNVIAECDAPLCSTCSLLDFDLILRESVARGDAIPLGPLPQILNKSDQCSFCRLIAIFIRRTWLLDEHPDVDLSTIHCSLYSEECGSLRDPEPAQRELCHRLYILPSGRPRVIYAAMAAAQTGLLLDIQLLEEDAYKFGRPRELHGRRVNKTVDIKLIKKWLGLCENDHGSVCDSIWWRGGRGSLPDCMRVVDVKRMALVPVPPACRFIALSYVWGGVGEEYWTARANVQQRTVAGGLDISVLPGTIADSIKLVRQLGERYLWVDALCIIQDDPEDKDVQIHFMELVYGSSLFTVFAAGGNTARSPLPGLRPGTRILQQHVEVIKGLHLAIPMPNLGETLARSTLYTRGWTYQELMLSRRRVYFTEQQVYFECGQEIWCEDVLAESKHLPRSYHPLRSTGTGTLTYLRAPPSWLKEDSYIIDYMSAIMHYTQRQLTVESDIIYAVTAITNALAKGFELGGNDPQKAFRFGMPVAGLNHALLWQPDADVSHSRRSIGDKTCTPWPSWSWAGWHGAVRYLDDTQYVTIRGSTHNPSPSEVLINSWYIVDDEGIIQLDVRRITVIIAEEDVGLTQYSPPQGTVDLQRLRHKTGRPLDRGTLIFRTTSAYFNVTKVDDDNSEVTNAGTHHAIFAILSRASPPARVGRIILPISTHSPAYFKFIVLSRASDIAGVYDEDMFGARYTGCLLYVMAVQKVGDTDTLERVGVGVIVEKAWLDSTAGETTVLLR
jgi:hypothetical protein